MWTLPYEPHPAYGEFKGKVYARIDPRMQAFFPAGVRASIRLDEIDWGGVGVNGIPPLVYPDVAIAQIAGLSSRDDTPALCGAGATARAGSLDPSVVGAAAKTSATVFSGRRGVQRKIVRSNRRNVFSFRVLKAA